MNRLDEIKAAALDAAQHVTQDPAKREALADDLITLVGLMIQAVGKSVATNGETDLNDPEDFEDRVSAHTRYLTGEQIQRGATWAVEESVAADLARYEEHGGQPVWRPRCPECGIRVGLYSDVQYGGRGAYLHRAGSQGRLPTGRRCADCQAELGHFPSCPARRQPGISDWARAKGFAEFLQPGAELGHFPSCPVLPNGQGPACDWDATCPVHGMPANASLSDLCAADICPGCGAEPSHGTECARGI